MQHSTSRELLAAFQKAENDIYRQRGMKATLEQIMEGLSLQAVSYTHLDVYKRQGLHGEVENPIHSTGVGLLLYGMAQQAYGTKRTYATNTASSEGWVERLKNWFNGNF